MQYEEQKEKKRMKKNEQSLRDQWDIINVQDTHNGSLRRKGKKGLDWIFEGVMVESFPNLLKNIINPRISMNSKYDKLKEIHTQTYHSQPV